MGFLMILATSILWSFSSIAVKMVSNNVNAYVISFSTYVFAVLVLGIYQFKKHKSLKINFKEPWIWIGAIGVTSGWVLRNVATHLGHAYGVILINPIQTIMMLLISKFCFKEKISLKSWGAAMLCVVGIFIVGWNGAPLGDIVNSGSIMLLLLYLLSGVGESIHMISEKVLIEKMDSVSINYSIFFLSLLITSPFPFIFGVDVNLIDLKTLSLMVYLGAFSTGFGFYLYTQALKQTPFMMAVIELKMSSLFTLLWAWLFIREPITIYIILGALMFIIGIILLNLFQEEKAIKTAEDI